MNFFEAATKRRSIRSFSGEAVPAEQLNALIDAARRAPSAGNGQPWSFVVIRNRALIGRLCPECCQFEWISKAGAVIAVCIDLARAKKRYGDRGLSLYCIQDTAAAVENILLGAEELGLSACWVGKFDEVACAGLLGLDDLLRPVAMIPLGVGTGESPPERRLRPLADIVRYID